MAQGFDPFVQSPGAGLDMDKVRADRARRRVLSQEERWSCRNPIEAKESSKESEARANQRTYAAPCGYAAGRPLSINAIGFVPSGPRPEHADESGAGRGYVRGSQSDRGSVRAGLGLGYVGKTPGFESRMAAGSIRGGVDYSNSSARQPQDTKMLVAGLDDVDDVSVETDVLTDDVHSPPRQRGTLPSGSEHILERAERLQMADSMGSTDDLKTSSSDSDSDGDGDGTGSMLAEPGSAGGRRRGNGDSDDERGEVVGVADMDMDDMPKSPPPALAYIETGDVAEFVQIPASDANPILCRVTKVDSIFYLHLEQPGQERKFLMAARGRRNARSKDFLISLDSSNISKNSAGYLGKLQCNLTRTEFTLYTGGTSRAGQDSSSGREELAAVIYGTTSLLAFAAGSRRMRVMLPHLNYDHERIRVPQKQGKQTLVEAYKNETLTESTVVLHNKLPDWIEEKCSYMLNFHGRVTKPSARNFQIIHPSDPKYIVLQFGRIGDNRFTMDYCYPMCALQAFGVALACCHGNSQ